MSKTTVHNKNMEKMNVDDINIMRPTRWGNPHIAGKNCADRNEAIAFHRRDLWRDLHTGVLPIRDLMKLDGKRLFCGCYPLKCHGNNYVDAIEIIKAGKMEKFSETVF